MIHALLLGLVLSGGVTNEYGRVGVRMSSSGGISHVYSHSPAADAGLQPGDVIIEADYHRGGLLYPVGHWVDGNAGQSVHLKVRRKRFVFEVDVRRVPPSEVFDEPDVDEIDTTIEDC